MISSSSHMSAAAKLRGIELNIQIHLRLAELIEWSADLQDRGHWPLSPEGRAELKRRARRHLQAICCLEGKRQSLLNLQLVKACRGFDPQSRGAIAFARDICSPPPSSV